MKYLLDTHILLWVAGQSARLSQATRHLLDDPDNELHFSSASLWEIAIKSAQERPDFQVDARQLRHGLIDNGYQEVAVTSRHAVAVLDLPLLHKDPFDRLILAQAAVEQLTLITADSIIARYPGSIVRV